GLWRRNRTAFRIQIEKVHGVISSKSGLSALEEKHLAKRARHSQEDDCYMFKRCLTRS
ncbi:hypothetical protein P4O66_018616, partial [Electrophorus voltai]